MAAWRLVVLGLDEFGSQQPQADGSFGRGKWRGPNMPLSRPRSDSKTLNKYTKFPSVCSHTASQVSHHCLAKIGIEPPATTVDLRKEPKHSPKPCTKRLSCPRLCRQSKHATELRFLSRCIRRHVVLAGLAKYSSYSILGKSSGSATEHVLRICCRSKTYTKMQLKADTNITKETGASMTHTSIFFYSS